MRRLLTLVLAALAALALPASALAHGVHGEAQTIPEFIWLGIRHMIGGWDHLLFIAGIVLLARSLLQAAKLISLFVLGHSTTLLVATLAGWQLNAEAVDVVIALSVAYIGWRNLAGQPRDWAWTQALIFGFGLAHGLGLSTRLQELALPAGGALVARILAFNLGVEIGQLLALTAIVGVALLAIRATPELRRQWRYAASGLIAFGLLAAGVFSFLALRPDDPVVAAPETTEAGPAAPAGSCVEENTPSTSEAAFGGHLDRNFFEPNEQAVRADLQHVLADGYIVVVYKRDLPEAQRAELRSWVEQAPATVGVAGATTMTDTLEALTARKRVRCTGFDLQALTDFRTRWFTGA